MKRPVATLTMLGLGLVAACVTIDDRAVTVEDASGTGGAPAKVHVSGGAVGVAGAAAGSGGRAGSAGASGSGVSAGAGGKASGGAAGVAGSAGAADRCQKNANLIDDMEGGSNTTCPFGPSKVVGGWYVAADPNETGTWTPMTSNTMTFVYASTPTVAPFATGHAAELSGAGPFTYYTPTLALKEYWSGAVNASSHSGVRFSAKVSATCQAGGSARCTSTFVDFQSIATTTQTDTPPGTCNPATQGCYDALGQWLNIGSAWATYSIPFANASLTRRGYGTAFPFDPSTLVALEWHVGDDPSYLLTYDLWIDDLEFTN